jgi:hypothetical protein
MARDHVHRRYKEKILTDTSHNPSRLPAREYSMQSPNPKLNYLYISRDWCYFVGGSLWQRLHPYKVVHGGVVRRCRSGRLQKSQRHHVDPEMAASSAQHRAFDEDK